MKSYFNSKKNREKHIPDKVLKKIKNSYENNSHKLILSLTKESSPLLNYNYNSQLSFLEEKKDDNKKELGQEDKDEINKKIKEFEQ